MEISFPNIRVSTVMKKHGENLVMEKVMENEQNNSLENILKKSWNVYTAYHESRMRNYDSSISIGLLQRGFWSMF